MASAEIMGEFLLSNNSNSASSNSLFSKFGRSPSRRHKSRPSSDTIDPSVAAAVRASKIRARPSVQRGTTEPNAVATLNSAAQAGGRTGIAGRKTSDGSSTLLSPVDKPGAMFAVPSLSASELSSDTQYRYVRSEVPKVPPIHGALAYNPSITALTNPNSLHQNIRDMSNKRMATLDYMRKAHEGRMFWFNTIKFSSTDVGKLPSYTPNRLARRATNYLVLGLSIPAVLDIHPVQHPSTSAATNSGVAQDYLRSLNALLAEFESYQQLHPPDGSTASTLTRARIPQIFKRSTARPRKSSGATGSELTQSISAPAMPEPMSGHNHQTSFEAGNSSSFGGSGGNMPAPGSTSFPTTAFPLPGASDAANSTLLPNEGMYTYLITPPLPFAPDFYTVFSTLCEVLIDVYQRLLQLLSVPDSCTPIITEMFTKADARIRKVMVGGILREFETASRDNAKKELMSVQKVVLGGLMGH